MIPGLPQGARSAAFGAFVSELQNHPMLRNERLVKSWRVWDGKSATNPPTVAQMPAVQLRLVAGPVRRIASTRAVRGPATFDTESKPTVAIEVWTAGSDQTDVQDLGDLIDTALNPTDPGERAAMKGRLAAVGIQDWHYTSEILPPALEAYTDAGIYAVGTYQLTLILRS